MSVNQVISIQVTTTAHDCDQCGSFWNSTAVITLPGGRQVELASEGHYGGGTWDGTDESLLQTVLIELGYTVNLEHTEESIG